MNIEGIDHHSVQRWTSATLTACRYHGGHSRAAFALISVSSIIYRNIERL